MKIVLTTGGTGGHIYPALALAKQLVSDHNILFVGGKNHIEKKIVSDNNFNFYGYKVINGNRNILLKIKQYYYLMLAFIKMFFKFLFNRPDLVIGFGAYISAPTLLAASILKIDIILHEQNSSMGKVNKIFFKKAKYVIVCYQKLVDQYNDKKVLLLGNPRGSEVLDTKANKNVLKELNLDINKKTILIVMGSLGSKTVNETMVKILPQFKDKSYQVVYVSGNNYFEQFKDFNLENVAIVPYINQVEVLLNTDLIVARGGATTAAEISVLGVSSIIVPSPYVVDNHQYYNAKVLEDLGGSKIILEEELSAKLLLDTIDSIIFDDNKLSKMKSNVKKAGFKNAREDIVNLINSIGE